jgi:hypothetical protein
MIIFYIVTIHLLFLITIPCNRDYWWLFLDIAASGLGIDKAPTKECGIISDEAHLIGRAKEKYEGM